MYKEFYGLMDDPFQLNCDRRFCFIHPSYAKAKAYMQFALHRAEGFIMITGRPGTGKTMLIQDITATINPAQIKVAHLVSVQLTPDDLLRMTAFAFGIDAHQSHKAGVLQRLFEFLLQHAQQGRRALLIIDEAQDIIPSALEELRLLTNIQYEGHSILQIFLIGQETLRDIIRSAEMEQVHQRLVAAWHLQPLSRSEIIGYVRHRLEAAGWRGNPAFKSGIFPLIYQFSQGIPRRINLICSRLLLQGFINETYILTANDAATVFAELQQEELTTIDQLNDELLP
ncbi:AAA family ATPase [Rhodoferax sp. 4810]|uniref:AAA family ATPase n=1 Tax=Thiospirillum jenense TaxID=1653858 RepID=A0A839HEJ8_9GAMM|nr:AAA family ATPase [Thiospirillum jenense]MBB1077940.1 AAA family ATPase [Rhodoferax jenense]MBB1127375.1 AAA family ATPase [Thiospirillum jenense]